MPAKEANGESAKRFVTEFQSQTGWRGEQPVGILRSFWVYQRPLSLDDSYFERPYMFRFRDICKLRILILHAATSPEQHKNVKSFRRN